MRTFIAFLATSIAALAQKEPTHFPPDAATRKQIEAKTEEMKKAVRILKPANAQNAVEISKWADVAVYAKAAEWMLRHDEWLAKETAQQTLRILEAGMKRAYDLEDGKTPWREIRGRPVIRGYVAADGSVQPYRVTLPEKWTLDDKSHRVDILLHGRDATLTEVKFLHAAEASKGTASPEAVVIEPYGRGNNAYRWAGETDVFAAQRDFFAYAYNRDNGVTVNNGRVVIRGFSMGGAGAWHLGLHHPTDFRAMAPGAGFTVTRGYIKDLPDKLPNYVERCLHIYDAVDYVDNLTIIPCVAYSGEIDGQIAAVRNIEARLKVIPLPVRFQHIIGTGLAHKLPKEWLAKVDEQIRKHLDPEAAKPEKYRFVTYTPRYGSAPFATIKAMEKLYEPAMIEGLNEDAGKKITTKNIRELSLWSPIPSGEEFDIDGVKLTFNTGLHQPLLKKDQGQWQFAPRRAQSTALVKRSKRQGPIDDAFMEGFGVVTPTEKAWNVGAKGIADSRLRDFTQVWNKYFRADLPLIKAEPNRTAPYEATVLFGDPGSNPLLREYLTKLPIQWTPETLVVNGKSYDAKTHLPVLIYPHPLYPDYRYLVLNSGHTFGEADLKGTNALLYPRLGDWAVLKHAPTKDDPHRTEVVDAGLFDENWQFEKKK